MFCPPQHTPLPTSFSALVALKPIPSRALFSYQKHSSWHLNLVLFLCSESQGTFLLPAVSAYPYFQNFQKSKALGAEGSVPQGTSLHLTGMNAPSSTMLASLRNPPDTHTVTPYPPLSASPDARSHAKTGGLRTRQPLTWGILTVQNGRSQDPPAKPACREDSLAFPF